MALALEHRVTIWRKAELAKAASTILGPKDLNRLFWKLEAGGHHPLLALRHIFVLFVSIWLIVLKAK